MAFRDNREFIAALERTGDVVRVEQEVDWDLEVGAIVRRACELRAPAPFFEKIKDYPAGYRIFGAPLATHRRMAVALGLAPDAPVREIQAEFERKVEHPTAPAVVKDAPCKENVIVGDDVDLYRFPTPMIHDGDGGRYIGTWHLIVTSDPDGGPANWGMYRVMIQNRRHLGVLLLPHQHQGKHFFEGYLPRGKPMPFAIAIGVDPLCCMVASTHFRREESEVEYAGALHGQPVELVKCETSDLQVPAHAEIVIEGEVLLDAAMPEGPFGEFTGYRTPLGMRPVWRVKAISHRNDPILTMTCMGVLQDDSAVCQSLTLAMTAKKLLQERGVPVKEVHFPVEFLQYLGVISVKTSEIGSPRDVPALGEIGISGAIVVDEDVDVFDLRQVLHALVTKCHPERGIRVSRSAFAMPLTPFLSAEEKRDNRGVRVLFDCTWPRDWSPEGDVPPRVSFDETYPADIRDRVIRNWQTYGFK